MAKWDRSKFVNNMGKLKEQEDASTGVDKRFWKPEAPKEGKNIYRIRMLPMDSALMPWVKVLKHQFKTPTGFFYENCPATLGHKCPIDEHAGILFNTGDPQDEIKARQFYRKKRFIANILVITDKKTPANEGKVFLWEFGTKLYDKFYAVLFPEPGLEQLIFIDPEKGFDINLITKTVSGFPNYDETQFVRESSPISTNPEEIDRIMESAYNLNEFIAESAFKSYEELDTAFRAKVLNATGTTAPAPQQQRTQRANPAPAGVPETLTDDEAEVVTPRPSATPSPKPATPAPKPAPAPSAPELDPYLADLEAELNKK